jgi:hypothetical protein
MAAAMVQDSIEGLPGRYWHPLADGRIQCDVCPRYCRLNEGQRGLCFVQVLPELGHIESARARSAAGSRLA